MVVVQNVFKILIFRIVLDYGTTFFAVKFLVAEFLVSCIVSDLFR